MKKTRFTESQIVTCIKEHESGRKVEDICRELGINRSVSVPKNRYRQNKNPWTYSGWNHGNFRNHR